MTRSKLHLVLTAAVALGVTLTAGDAFAGWRWHGSSGGSSGGWGGSSGGSSGGWGGSSGGWGGSSGGWGGSSGGWGSSGGGSSGGWHHKHRHRRSWGSSGGSSGGWGGSSGGSSGSYGYNGGSSGGWGGSSGGSSGGGGYYAPSYYAPAYDAVPVEGSVIPSTSVPPAGGTLPPVDAGTSIDRANGLLVVEVPTDAKIFVNGQATSSTGDLRQYVSRDLQAGMTYNYEVRAEVVRDGKTVEEVKTVELRAGEQSKLAFDFAPASDVETSLTLHVPENARVFLAGRETSAKGETRVFRTTGLSDGKAWSDYSVRVEFELDGQKVVKEEKVNLGAGESLELHFDANGDRVAAR